LLGFLLVARGACQIRAKERPGRVRTHPDRALTGSGVGPMNTQSPNTAAGEHFADAERILAALPLVKRRAEPDRHIQIALVHATLAVAAGLPGEWQNREEPPEQP
jgi:hypothetical protein